MNHLHTVHIIATGKGGVGKSFVAWNLAEYLSDKGHALYNADTDPTNATFSGYLALGAEHINISDLQMKIDKKKFDHLANRIVSHDGDCVVDNGGSSFLPLMDYLKQNRLIDLLRSRGRRVMIHTPLVGGQAMDDTIRGLQSILEFTNADVVVWENEVNGPIVKSGLWFSDSPLFKQYSDRILGIVRISHRDDDMFASDLKEITTRHLTYREALESSEFGLMPQQRLTMVREEIFEKLESLGL